MIDRKKIYKFYEKTSKSYSQNIFYEADTEYQKNILDNIRNHLNLSAESKLASIGCGNGSIESTLARLYNLKEKILVVDSNEKMLAYTRSNNYLESILMDGLKFVKDPNFHYDKCLLKEVIHHFSENEIYQIYQGIYNQLTEDGTALTITRNQETEYPFFLEAIEKWQQIQPPLELFIKAQEISGFEVTLEEVSYRMYVSKKDWVNMLRNRFWSHLSEIEDDRLDKGITEIEERYKEFETLSFNDCLIFLIGRKLPLIQSDSLQGPASNKI